MAALATVADAATFGYSLDPDTGPMLLERASARVRGYTKQTISRVTDDVVTLPVIGRTVRLPQRPADKPTRVKIGGVVFLENTAWTWDAVYQRITHLNPYIVSANFTGWTQAHERQVEVTYSHGYVTVPEELKEVVCAIASRLASATSGMEGGVRSEAVGGVSVTYAAESLDMASNLLPGEKAAIDAILGKPRVTTMQLGSG